MKKIVRNTCVICTAADLEHVFTFKKFPIYMGAQKGQKERREDQEWVICKSCGCVQLKELLPMDILYQVPHNPALGETWSRHNKCFADFIIKNGGSTIMEVGGGNCRIAKEVVSRQECVYSIYDKSFYDDTTRGINKVNEFLDPEKYCDKTKYDTIVSSHMVEHMYNPLEYMKFFSKILPIGGKVLYSFPDITNVIRDKLVNGPLNFEHTYQVDSRFLEKMMSQFGFDLVAEKNFSRYNPMLAFEKVQSKAPILDTGWYKRSKEDFCSFIEYQKNNTERISKAICGKNVYLFGCHIFSQCLLELGVDEKLIKGIIDNDEGKQGHRLYGTNLMTYPSSIVGDYKEVSVVVQAGVYSEEITKKLLDYNNNCEIIE